MPAWISLVKIFPIVTTRERILRRYVRILTDAIVLHFLFPIKLSAMFCLYVTVKVLSKATSYAKSNLQGCRFYKAYLVSTPVTCIDANYCFPPFVKQSKQQFA